MRLLIVGGVAGGATAAARARRLDADAEIIMFDRGEYPSFANCGLAYYIGGEIAERERLFMSSVDQLNARYAIDVRMRSEVKRILSESQEIEVENLDTGEVYREHYDKLLLAPGAEPIKPPLPGIDLDGIFTLRTVADADAIKNHIATTHATRAVIVGGGFIGLEMAEMLRRLSLDVTIVELQPQVMLPLDPEMAAHVHQELKLNGVQLVLGCGVASFSQDGTKMRVHLSDESAIDCDLALLCIGGKPAVQLAQEAGLTIGGLKGLVVDEHMRTSDPNIYAAGDVVENVHFVDGEPTLTPLGGPANRQARVAADNMCGRDSHFDKVQGTAMVRVFGLAVAGMGSNEKTLKRRGATYAKCYLHPNNHGSYYPGASRMAMKLLFTPDEGKILGAQIVGGDGVDKRIDVLATAMRAGMTVFDLEGLELAYAPQWGAAKDPINMAGFVASNMLRGDMDYIYWDEVDEWRQKGALFLDVRTDDEVVLHRLEGSTHIPLESLRTRMDELPRDKPIVAYCNNGHRSYIACRALKLAGFPNVRNLSGGWATYATTLQTDDQEAPMSEPQNEATSEPAASITVATLDACGLQCPGPIVELNKKVKDLQPGDVLEISATDPGFASDLPAWCDRTGYKLLSLDREDGKLVGRVRVPGESAQPAAAPAAAASAGNDKTIVVFSNDLDRAIAAFIIANGAAAMGRKVTLFFTFWGLNVLRKNPSPPVKKGLIDRMFGMMMPKGPTKLKLSKMHMAGMGTAMMKMVMSNKNVHSLPEFIELAKEQGVRLVACTMSMDVMGIKREELIDGVEEGGVAAYLGHAETSDVNLFI